MVSKQSTLIHVRGTRATRQARLTALTPDSCWPMFRIMMEISCQRRERWDSRETTVRWPSARSDWSSRRISVISASTLSQPRRRCSAKSDKSFKTPLNAVLLQPFKAVFAYSYLSLRSFRLPSGWACTGGSLGKRAAAEVLSRRECQSSQAWGSSLNVKMNTQGGSF